MTNIIFTSEADAKLSEIIKKFNLDKFKALVKIDSISKSFAKGEIEEKGIADYLQKELEIPRQTAEQISKEIVTNIIPLLIKASEEDLKNPDSREEISKKVFGEKGKTEKTVPIKPTDAKEGKKTDDPETPINRKSIKTSKKRTEETSKLPKKIIRPEMPKSSGSDKYREPIG